jgi:hypothetical protein
MKEVDPAQSQSQPAAQPVLTNFASISSSLLSEGVYTLSMCEIGKG